MTPAPATASARRQASARPATRRTGTPQRPPRRASGPSRTPTPQRQAALAGATVARPVVLPRPTIGGGLAERLGAWLRNLPDHRLLDRLLRGRAWIVLIGVLLAGIVALQVSMLKLNSGISRAVEHEQTLQRENQALQANVAALGSDNRLRTLAEQEGFISPASGGERYLTVGPNDAQRAARAMKPPQPHTTTAAATTPATTPMTTPAATTTTPTTTSGATTPSTTTPATTTPSTTTGQPIAPPPTGNTGGTGTGTAGATGVTNTTGATTGGAGTGG